MRLVLFNSEYWIKDDIKLPLNFDSMNDSDKWNYIHENSLYHRHDGPAIVDSYYPRKGKRQRWYLNGKLHRIDGPAEGKRRTFKSSK